MKNKILLFIVLILLAGCQGYQKGYNQATESSPQPVSSNTNAVIEGFKFQPATIQAKVGETLTWTQKDGSPHTVTSTSGPESFDSGKLGKGQMFSYTFSKPGTYQYKCSIHPSMEGTIIVG